MLSEMHVAPEFSHCLAASGKNVWNFVSHSKYKNGNQPYTMWYILETVTFGYSFSLVQKNIHQSLYWNEPEILNWGLLWMISSEQIWTNSHYLAEKQNTDIFFFHFSKLIIPLKFMLGTSTIQPRCSSL